MNSLYEIFLQNIIDKEHIEDRQSSLSNRLSQLERNIRHVLKKDNRLSQLFDEYKSAIINHMLMIRDEDCERVLAVALKFSNLINDKLSEIGDLQ